MGLIMDPKDKKPNNSVKNTENEAKNIVATAGVNAIKEEEILKFWQENKIFEKTLNRKAKDDWAFYDGPPFATGTPHYGHILASVIKDAVPRYWTMKGYRVPRKWGWDCHGLPVENLIEKELGLKSKKEIEAYGIEKFNEAAKESVLRYADEWKKIIPRVGRWVDMENDYKTMDTTYTESVISIFKNIYNKGLIYEGFKSMQICPRCETSLSNFEVNQGYKDITDISVFVKFELVDKPNTFLVAWTTTPWTLPGNVALAIKPDMKYVKAKSDDAFYIFAKERMEALLNTLNKSETKISFEVVEEFNGSDLVGKKYKPVFDYYNNSGTKNIENAFKVYGAEFVTSEDGTGIVHIAPAFGEDDMNLGKANNLPFVQHVSMDGKFKPEVTDFAGEFVKPLEDHQKVDIMVIKYLAGKNSLLAKEKMIHSYPHCWRCDTPLLNYATSSWFVKVSDEKLKAKLLSENKKIGWHPEDIGPGRFGKWLEGARDWAISRSRFWGAPIPVWKCDECKNIEVLGSVKEINSKFKSKNNYYVIRHGHTEYNAKNLISDDPNNPDHLTKQGRAEVKAMAKKLSKVKFDLVISSPFVRTRETTEILADEIGYSLDKVVLDKRLGEVYTDGFLGRNWNDFIAFLNTPEGKNSKHETQADVLKRIYEFMKETDSKNSGKNILIVTHGAPTRAFRALITGEKYEGRDHRTDEPRMLKNAEVMEFGWFDTPRNDKGLIDFHRPHIDKVIYPCKCGGSYKRIPDVFDCWFESGSVPYGQNHYVCEPTENFDPKKNKAFPSEFIGEGLDQTRGWFYTMHILAVALFGKSSYKNVIVNGLILAEDGRKMSKKLKNYPDPADLINKYGVDSLRYYLLSSPVVSAQELRFSEKGVDEISKKIVARLYSVLSFIDMYGDISKLKIVNSKNVLDIWMKTRLVETTSEITESLENYTLDKASRPIADFVEDLSNWYLRRSRDRLRGDDGKDKTEALSTLVYVMKEFSKVIAPIMPFTAEVLYGKLKNSKDEESVHLEKWPKVKFTKSDQKILDGMTQVRALVELGHFARQESKMNVRQPLADVVLNVSKIDKNLISIISDELNVKTVTLLGKKNAPTEGYVSKEDGKGLKVFLNINISDELREEGKAREILRLIQDDRKKQGLVPRDNIIVVSSAKEAALRDLIDKHKDSLMKIANIKSVETREQEEIVRVIKI